MKCKIVLLRFTFLIFVLVFRPAGVSASGEAVNHDLFAELLAEHVENGLVDYSGFQREEEKLDAYLKILEQTDVRSLSREEQLAFYINAYNANTIKLVLSGYPGIKSIKDLGRLWRSPWKKKFVRIDGKVLSLDDIEHGIIRPQFQDARIHFAVNCAAGSCPPLIAEPYRGEKLGRQLDEVTRAFINDPASNYLEGDTLHVSRIFDWYETDFSEGIVPFFLKYAEGNFKRELEKNRDRIKVRYLHYDWSLNGK